ncbi:hypothetical protein PWEIH_11635 [Listeria weihenstephanensis FSL R9-0317]|uniref:Uncharacterized protein n=1 Tax=Listeria weihenstephanensis TaxID=1006155 RepID=A0A1S7FUY4_9LIST|nr:hypothetical protein [Listeria weihenstephanensis]AQY51256.1 hypothetical protein UE46_09450 [Listeria weihenstephanensis]EUJ36806.1 hypothetical protein PWEIH_11635 [Listeria weihenstephanensis FSL R9-0317]
MIWQIVVIALGVGLFVLGLFYSKDWHNGWLDGGWPDFDGWDSFFISIIIGIIAFIFMILPWYVMKSIFIVGGLTLVYCGIWVFSF